MEILCSLKHLTLSFGPKRLFEDAQMTLRYGERVGLLGLNGHGKSSLFKILEGKLTPDQTNPPLKFDKSNQACDSSGRFSVFCVPQSPPFLDSSISVERYIYKFYPLLDQLMEQLKEVNERLDKNDDSPSEQSSLLNKQKNLWEQMDHNNYWEIIQTYESYLKFFELDDLERPISKMSGGEQKKVLLSLGLSSPCQLILWDEPTNHLDLETIEILEQELLQSSKSIMLTSHDRYFLSKVTQRILHIENKVISNFEGNYTDYLEHLSEKEAERRKLVQKLKNNLKRETDWMRQGVKARGTRSKKRVENFNQLLDQVKELQSRERKNLNIELSHTGRQTKALVEVKSLGQRFDDIELFNDVNLNIHKKDKIGLLGANGVGKTTLIHLLCQQISPSSGEIKTADDLVIKHFSQKRKELNENETPYQFLGQGQDQVILPNGHSQHVVSYFEKYLFHRDDIHRPIKYFSGGERNRLQLAYHMLGPADLWIFDEPTNDLDLETLEVLEKTLSDFKNALILISHDRAFLNNVTNKIWLIHDQNVETFQGGYAQAENFLEALKLESLLLKQNQGAHEGKANSSKNEGQKSSPKNSATSLELTSKIKEHEELIEKLQKQAQKLAEKDLSSPESTKRYGEINSLVAKLEEQLLEYYELLEKA